MATGTKRKKAPTVKQLRARAKFVKMVRARAKALKAAKRATAKRPVRRATVKRATRRRNAKPLYGPGGFRPVSKATTGGLFGSKKKPTKKKKNPLSVVKAGRRLYGAAAAAVLASRAGKKEPARRRNAEVQSAAHPIAVRRYYRSGGPGYMSAWKRAEKHGQQRLFRMNKGKATKKRRNGVFRTAARQAIAKRLSAPVFGRRKRNGAPAGIEQMHEKFLGRPTHKTDRLLAPSGTPADVAVLGELTKLKTDDEEFIFDKGEAFMGADAKGNLYVLGDVLVEKNANFGKIEEICYLAKKDHLNPAHIRGSRRRKARRNPGQLIEYYHYFGEEGGTLPKLKSDSDGALHIAGGSYTIEAEGITN